MRKPTDICLLCQENNSTKKKSHIIPKFFGKGIFDGSKPRHGIKIYKNGKRKRVQDIIKEDYILCPECERGFSIFETYCSFRLERFNELRYFSKFNWIKRGDFEYFECKELDIRIFNLFIYSIVWRVSISENYEFGAFKLPDIEEKNLREFLKRHIKSTQSELIDAISKVEFLPNHSHVIIRPKKKLRPPDSMLSAVSLNEWVHEIHLVDYIIFYFTDKEKNTDGLKEIENNNLVNMVKVGLASIEGWKSYSNEMIKSIM
jgi:hypothetical protein